MSIVARRGGVDIRPEGLPSLMPNVANVSRLGGGFLIGGIGAAIGAVKAFRRVPEKCVGVKTLNQSAVDRHSRPRHRLLYPGGHIMTPLHDIDIVKLEHQTIEAATIVDYVDPVSNAKTQYNIRANVTWGLKTSPPLHTWGRIKKYAKSGNTRSVDFNDAYNALYGLSSDEDQERKVKSIVESFLLSSAKGLVESKRDADNLGRAANLDLKILRDIKEEYENNKNKYTGERTKQGIIDVLGEYGLMIYGIEVSNFSTANRLEFSNDTQVSAAPPQALE